MAINLSRSFAKPCDILCDLTIDDVAIPETVVWKQGNTGWANFDKQQPSIKFNGEGQTCVSMLVKAPSYHTIEDIRADAEIIAVCVNPQNKIVLVSTLVRTNSGASRMNTFLNAFIPQFPPERSTRVNLGPDWSLTQMVPPEPAQYSYRGKSLLPGPGGETVQQIVFRSMGNIDPNAQAHLTRTVGSVATPMINRTQEVFFNDTSHLSGVPSGKALMRCRRVKKKGEEVQRITPVKGVEDLAAKRAAEEDKSNTTAWIKQSIADQAKSVGGYPILGLYVLVGLVGLFVLYLAWDTIQGENGLMLAKSAQGAAGWLRGKTAAAAAQATVLAKVASAKATTLAVEGAKKSTELAKVASEKSANLALEDAPKVASTAIVKA